MKENFSNKEIDRSFVKKAKSYPLLTEEEERKLIKSVNNGDKEARTLFINSNLRLIPWVLKRKFPWVFNRMSDIEPMDLVQEGLLGLNVAIKKFDSDVGKFSTYAIWWIYQSMQRFLANSKRTIRFPVHIDDSLNKYLKIRNKHCLLFDEIDISDISKEANITIDKALEIEELLSQKIVRLDQRISGDEDTSYLYEMIKDPFSDKQEHDLDQSILQKELNNQLKENLSPKQVQILELRFGLKGEDPYTLEEVGQKLNLTRERIRQIQEQAFSVLRDLESMQRLFTEHFGFTPHKKEKKQTVKNNLVTIPVKEEVKNDDKERKLLLEKYLELAVYLNRRPNFSDIEKYSEKCKLPDRSIFEKHFGSMFKLWRQSGFIKSETKTIIPEKGIISFKISFRTVSELSLVS